MVLTGRVGSNPSPGATVPSRYPSYIALFAFPECFDSFFSETRDVFVYMCGCVRFQSSIAVAIMKAVMYLKSWSRILSFGACMLVSESKMSSAAHGAWVPNRYAGPDPLMGRGKNTWSNLDIDENEEKNSWN